MSIPHNLEELKTVRQWVNFVRIWNDTKHGGQGGYDKPPIDPHTLRDGKTNDPATWATYIEAASNIGKTATHIDTKHKDENGKAPRITAPIEGAGLVLAGGYCGVDFDDVIDDEGNLAAWVTPILDALDTYTEISPSGHGLHALLFCGDLMEAGKDFGKQFLLDKAGAITNEAGKVYELEVYFYQSGGRYLTVTGDAYRDLSINRTKGETLRKIFDEYTAKQDAYKAAQRPPRSVGTHTTPGCAAAGDDDRKMIESALASIDPSELVFEEWSSIMTALNVLGFSQSEAEAWSSGSLGGYTNPKNDPGTNARRWHKFNYKRGDDHAAGVIINEAKRQGWRPADAFDDEERAEYGRSLYTDDQRREYGRRKHEEQLNAFWAKHSEGFKEWQARKKAEREAEQKTNHPKQPAKITPEQYRAIMEARLKNEKNRV